MVVVVGVLVVVLVVVVVVVLVGVVMVVVLHYGSALGKTPGEHTFSVGVSL